MVNDDTGELAAITTILALYIDARLRKACLLPSEVHARTAVGCYFLEPLELPQGLEQLWIEYSLSDFTSPSSAGQFNDDHLPCSSRHTITRKLDRVSDDRRQPWTGLYRVTPKANSCHQAGRDQENPKLLRFVGHARQLRRTKGEL